MPSSKRQRTNKRKTQLRRRRRSYSRKLMKGGGCGCGANPLFSGGNGAVPATLNITHPTQKGGRKSKRNIRMRGGFFTGNYSINSIANFGTSSGASSNANVLYGATDVNPSPSSQNISYYNTPHNIRAA